MDASWQTCVAQSNKILERGRDVDRNDAENARSRGDDYFRSTNGDRYTNLKDAITEYEKALQFFTSELHPTEWGQIQTDLIDAKQELSNKLKALEESIRRLQSETKPPYSGFLTRPKVFFLFLSFLIFLVFRLIEAKR